MDNIDSLTKTLGCKRGHLCGRLLLIYSFCFSLVPFDEWLRRCRRIPSPRFLGEILQVGGEVGYLDSSRCPCGFRCSWVHQTPRETSLQRVTAGRTARMVSWYAFPSSHAMQLLNWALHGHIGYHYHLSQPQYLRLEESFGSIEKW